jgi:3-deoxy-manno-octulosonate cytidylyltransferase (CMP-KDO synthetase)
MLLERVWRRTVDAACFERVLVATDHPTVADAARGFGAEVALTGEAPSGTHRVALVTPPDVAVVNVQADQPFLDPGHLCALVGLVGQGAEVATLCTALDGAPDDPALVKVALDGARALDFSRRPIPAGGPFRRHLGLYGFGPGAVHRCAAAPRSDRAREEDLEQLAWMDAGIGISVAEVDRAPLAVDTAAQLAAARALLSHAVG